MANERFQNALKNQAQATPPIWMMRQAGRYHKHYQGLRTKHGFMELCKQPELAAEVALGPVQDFDFDLAILFSDLLFPLEALGMGLKYEPGPILGWHLDAKTILNIKSADEALVDLQFQKEAMQATRSVLPNDKSLIGFVGGPWTLYTYAAEGGHKGNLQTAKSNLPLFSKFCETLVPLLIENIKLQLEGGAEAVMVLDTAAGEVSPQIFRDLIEPQLAKIAAKFPGQLGYYSKGTTSDFFAGGLWQNSSWMGLGFDHRWSMRELLLYKNTEKQINANFIQGNFDQALLFNEPESFEKLLHEFLKPMAELSPEERKGWICGLGHGILPKTPEENVRSFVQIVREVFS